MENHQVKPEINEFIEGQLSVSEKKLYDTCLKRAKNSRKDKCIVEFTSLPMINAQFAQISSLITELLNEDEYRVLHNDNSSQIFLTTVEGSCKILSKLDNKKHQESLKFFTKVIKIFRDHDTLCKLYDDETVSNILNEKGIVSVMTHGKKTVYLGDLGIIDGHNIIKVGSSDGLKSRVRTLKRNFINGFTLVFAVEHNDNRAIEKRFFEHPEIRFNMFGVRQLDGLISKESIKLDTNLTRHRCVEIIKEIIDEIDSLGVASMNNTIALQRIALEKSQNELKVKQMDMFLQLWKSGVDVNFLAKSDLFKDPLKETVQQSITDNNSDVNEQTTSSQVESKKQSDVEIFINECTKISNTNILIVDLYNLYLQWCKGSEKTPILKGKFIDGLQKIKSLQLDKKVRVVGRKGPQLGIHKRDLNDVGIQIRTFSS